MTGGDGTVEGDEHSGGLRPVRPGAHTRSGRALFGTLRAAGRRGTRTEGDGTDLRLVELDFRTTLTATLRPVLRSMALYTFEKAPLKRRKRD